MESREIVYNFISYLLTHLVSSSSCADFHFSYLDPVYIQRVKEEMFILFISQKLFLLAI